MLMFLWWPSSLANKILLCLCLCLRCQCGRGLPWSWQILTNFLVFFIPPCQVFPSVSWIRREILIDGGMAHISFFSTLISGKRRRFTCSFSEGCMNLYEFIRLSQKAPNLTHLAVMRCTSEQALTDI